MNIPRKNSEKVQGILNRDDLNNHEKAIMIHNYDYNMLCLENGGYLPKYMSIQDIEKELNNG